MDKTSTIKARIKALAQVMQPNSVAVLPSASHKVRSRDTLYPYRQNSSLHYLTGSLEPNTTAVLIVREVGDYSYYIFNEPKDALKMRWEGNMLGQEGAISELCADKAFSIKDFSKELVHILNNKDALYYDWGRYGQQSDQTIITALNQVYDQVRKGVSAPSAVYRLDTLIDEQRLIKSKEEIQLMQKSAEIAVNAHRQVMTNVRPGLNERELEGWLYKEFMAGGASGPSYSSIVAGGANACVLHYIDNNQVLNDGDLLLIDAGCEYNYYASDITRTMPVNGKFSSEQKALYECVLAAQEAGLAVIKPGVKWQAIQDAIVPILTQGLIDEGILKGSLDDLINEQAYKDFYMHNSGHWLGLDVHDVGTYKVNNISRELQPGMALTIEPGLYISKDAAVDEKWQGIGIRIEDDVVVNDSSYLNLTEALPKTIADIENIMSDI